jgi:inner membrane protein
MPSPIAHAAVGYLIHTVRERKNPTPSKTGDRSRVFVLLAVVFFSVLPDIDFLPGLLIGDIGRFHNQGTHSLLAALAVALLAGLAARWRKASFRSWFGLAFISYSIHLLMDALTFGGRGVKLFWPFSQERYDMPVSLFLGARWSEDLWNVEHLPTLFSELAFAGLIFLGVWLYDRYTCSRKPCPEV